jgi:hypothetical protein
MRYGKLAIAIAAFVAVTAAHTGARAQSSAAQAEALFRQGKDLIAHGKIAEACAFVFGSVALASLLAHSVRGWMRKLNSQAPQDEAEAACRPAALRQPALRGVFRPTVVAPESGKHRLAFDASPAGLR